MDLPDDELESATSTESGHSDGRVILLSQAAQLENPDARVILEPREQHELLSVVANSWQGIKTSDDPRFTSKFWEMNQIAQGWHFYQRTPDESGMYVGRSEIIFWEDGRGQLTEVCQEGASFRGQSAWRRHGIAVHTMAGLSATPYTGEMFSADVSVIDPKNQTHTLAIWAFCTSSQFVQEVRKVDRALRVTNTALVKVPYDATRWLQIAHGAFPDGLPEPQTNDATQWLFHGHPAGMLAAGPASASPFGLSDPVGSSRHPSLVCRGPNLGALLQVAVARIAGYRWPAETDSTMRLDAAVRAWADRCGELARFADDDGVVPLAPMRSEPGADARVRELLRFALGDAWSSARESTLLAEAARASGGKSPAASLDDWLRNRFFEEHCALFHQRPFVWHIWDGRKKDGFGVLVHYHRLVAPNGAGRRLLEKLTHGYLGDWIKRQRDESSSGKEGADARLAAALALQEKLTKILEGEPPYDLFVRWKPLHQQPIGWEPDINDGVRISIRPFIEADILRVTPKIKWTKDRGSEPHRAKADFPWFWGWDERTEDFAGGSKFIGERFNDLHYTTAFKRAARERRGER